MKLEAKDYRDETLELWWVEEGMKLDTETLLKNTKEDLWEVISGINFSINKEAYEKVPEGAREMRKLATLIAFMGKAVELGNLKQKEVTYKLAQISAQTKKALNLKENPIKIIG